MRQASGGGRPDSPSACANQVLDMELSANEFANEQIMADAWKGHTSLPQGSGVGRHRLKDHKAWIGPDGAAGPIQC